MARGKAKTKSMAEVMKEAADVPPAPPAAREPSMVEVLSRIAFALEQIERKLEAPRVEGGHSPAGYGTGVATKPAAVTEAEQIDFTWGNGGPKDALSDHFAMRAVTKATLPAGYCKLTTLSDDGVRVLVDGKVVLEDWTWHGPTEKTATVQVEAGEHEIVVEHFEIDGYAVLRLDLMMYSCIR